MLAAQIFVVNKISNTRNHRQRRSHLAIGDSPVALCLKELDSATWVSREHVSANFVVSENSICALCTQKAERLAAHGAKRAGKVTSQRPPAPLR